MCGRSGSGHGRRKDIGDGGIQQHWKWKDATKRKKKIKRMRELVTNGGREVNETCQMQKTKK